MLSELGVGFILHLFSFQKSYIGRGLFIIFIGVLCLDCINILDTFIGKLNLAVGIILLIYGVFLTALGFVGDNEPLLAPVFSKK